MPISESQLETWSHRSQTDTAVNAHTKIREAMIFGGSRLISSAPTVFLQGSYRNYTNIHSDSDVDVVVKTTNVWNSDLDALGPVETEVYWSEHSPSSYIWETLHSDVTSALQQQFGTNAVSLGKKAIRVEGKPGVRLPADVVAANEHRRYNSYSATSREDYVRGIFFKNLATGEEIINYPEQHYENGVAKQAATSDWFKPTVRILKNARNYLIDNYRIDHDCASSYFIQCLLYNVPSREYGGSHRLNFNDVLDWLQNHRSTMSSFVCQNGLTQLFGDTAQHWNLADAVEFLEALDELNS